MTDTVTNGEEEPVGAPWVPRVIQGGKGGGGDLNAPVWLSDLPVGTVFVAAAKGSMYGSLYELVHKGRVFCLLHQDMGNDIIADVRVLPSMWCQIHKNFEVLGSNLPTRGDEDVREQCNPGGVPDVVLHEAVSGEHQLPHQEE